MPQIDSIKNRDNPYSVQLSPQSSSMPTYPLTLPTPANSPNSPAVSPKHGSMDFCLVDKGHSIGWNSFWNWIATYCVMEITSVRAPQQIAQTPILPLRCVDALRGMGLRAVLARFADPIYTLKWGCVKLTLETPSPSGFPD
jgi:hypothetical protein